MENCIPKSYLLVISVERISNEVKLQRHIMHSTTVGERDRGKLFFVVNTKWRLRDVYSKQTLCLKHKTFGLNEQL